MVRLGFVAFRCKDEGSGEDPEASWEHQELRVDAKITQIGLEMSELWWFKGGLWWWYCVGRIFEERGRE
ncbi:hypothetical protein E3N88_45321 [Mikania micrantha]|uniref:Uncharacterized protein n=1 Tax=Mikania micrantha TaxID=192012 RepID=A0A5N6L9H1_9ASTR|nr:hypothetical protein E3N88_45321 [Mikania micrantha]